LSNYLNACGELHTGEEITGVTTMNRVRGCSRARNPCSFCNIFTLDPQFSTAKIFWDEVVTANKQVNANVFYEVCDSFSSFPKHIDTILEAQPILPYIGNVEGDQLIKADLFVVDKENPDWPPSINILSSTYVNNFSKVKYDDILFSVKNIMAYAEKHGKTTGSALIKEESGS